MRKALELVTIALIVLVGFTGGLALFISIQDDIPMSRALLDALSVWGIKQL